MSTWAVLAAKQAAIASGLGVGVVPAIGTGSVDGFLIGALMSGACCAMMSGPGRAKLRAGRAAALRTVQRGEQSLGGVPALAGVPSGVPVLAGVPSGIPALTVVPGGRNALASARVNLPALAAAPVNLPVLASTPAAARVLAMAGLGSSKGGKRSRHAADAEPDERQDTAGDVLETGEAEDVEASGYRSRHRLGDTSSGRSRQDSRRNAPKHAAPPVSFASRMSGVLSPRTILSTARH